MLWGLCEKMQVWNLDWFECPFCCLGCSRSELMRLTSFSNSTLINWSLFWHKIKIFFLKIFTLFFFICFPFLCEGHHYAFWYKGGKSIRPQLSCCQDLLRPTSPTFGQLTSSLGVLPHVRLSLSLLTGIIPTPSTWHSGL